MKKFLLVFCILIALGMIFSFYLWSADGKKEREFQESVTKYSFLSPRILRETHDDYIFNFLELRSKLHEKVDQLKDNFAMYFEYLPTGTSIGINSTNEFYAASLFKLPLVMAYFRHKERTNSDKSLKVKLTKDMIDNRFGDLWKKGVGYEIDLDDAAKIALVKSDNTAAEALGPIITQNDFDEVYQGLDINIQIASQGAILTTRNYSSILKALYFSAVLTKLDSQKILSYLAQTEFNDKLVAGVPSEVPVAHKIGVIEGDSYRDCGIIYLPSRPYILCMISKGTEAEAQQRMKDVSKMIYDYVSTANSTIINKP